MKLTKDNGQSLITLENITIRVRDQFILPETSWVIKKNQHWGIIGPNGAGKSSLVRALAGELPVVGGEVAFFDGSALRDHICYVSFELHQQLIAREEDRDASRYFSHRLDDVTTARRTILQAQRNSNNQRSEFDHIVQQLDIEHLLERGIPFLSTGEMRKVMIARALLKSPQLIILDEPFEGLDASSRSRLADMINALMTEDRQIILVTHRLAEILPNISHVLGLKNGRVLFQGKRDELLDSDQMEALYQRNSSNSLTLAFEKRTADLPAVKIPDVLVEMKNTTIRYNNVVILDHLNWTMKSGENWAIIGPNGSGKTTLLSLITGDSPQAYANEVYLFGKKRGTGESIWDIKKRIGMVSSEFQIRYRKPITVFEVVLSGFFDSVGLYRISTRTQTATAARWIDLMGMTPKTATPFNQLSYGEQRLVLLARSMVKSPLLLILDEPCQGLDRANRKMILDVIDWVARQRQPHILFVTHHADEIPACINHMLRFEKTPNGGYSTICVHV